MLAQQRPGWWFVDGSLVARRIFQADPQHFIPTFCRRAQNLNLAAASVNSRCLFVFDSGQQVVLNAGGSPTPPSPSSSSSPAASSMTTATTTAYWRREFLPGYKSRTSFADAGQHQLYASKLQQLCEEFFPVAGIPVVHSPAGVEGDDVLAELTEREADGGRCVTLLSTDKDLLQVLCRWPHVEVCDPFLLQFCTPFDVKRKYGVLPHRLPEYLAINGDASDNIPGVDGMGPKRIAVLFDSLGAEVALEDIVRDVDGKLAASNLPKRYCDLLTAAADRVLQNCALARLPPPRKSDRASPVVGISAELVEEVDRLDLIELSAAAWEQRNYDKLDAFADKLDFPLHYDLPSLYQADTKWRKFLFRELGQQYTAKIMMQMEQQVEHTARRGEEGKTLPCWEGRGVGAESTSSLGSEI
eukprot:g17205.t1